MSSVIGLLFSLLVIFVDIIGVKGDSNVPVSLIEFYMQLIRLSCIAFFVSTCFSYTAIRAASGILKGKKWARTYSIWIFCLHIISYFLFLLFLFMNGIPIDVDVSNILSIIINLFPVLNLYIMMNQEVKDFFGVN